MSESKVASHPRRIETGVLATIYGLGSAIGYTSANVCLRTVTELDPVWVSCVKSVPTVLLVAPVVLWRAWNLQSIFPAKRILFITILGALVGQLIGNVLFQWALGVIGMALDVPIVLGSMIVSSAVLGQLLLGETVTPRMAVASAVLILAITVLSCGAKQAHAAVTLEFHSDGTAMLIVVAGVVCACLSGLAYCILSVAMRYATNRGTPLSSLLFTVCVVGLVTLGAWTLWRVGWETVTETNRSDYLALLGAGLFNFLAFLSLAKALQIASVLFVNALNATQAGMAAVAGVIIFNEALTNTLGLGIMLTIIGLILMKARSERVERKIENQIDLIREHE